jgi:beta-aspartyl-peptidase (threonine type)
MRLTLLGLAMLLLASCQQPAAEQAAAPAAKKRPAYAIAIHGGAGTIRAADLTAEQDAAYRAALDSALQIGEKVLQGGGAAIDAVEQTIRFLEDSPLFNAGRGAVFTHEGRNELDASIMQGKDLSAGAVAGITIVRHPIAAARAVMEQSPHVMLTGQGAEQFAREKGLEIVDPSYFFTQQRWDALQRAKAEEATRLDHDGPQGSRRPSRTDYKFGTVGCVALDRAGNLVAGTSTGGMTNKRWNRVGDAPVIGAGTYANNETCAVSCTGHGEYFIRWAVAHDVSALMAYKGLSLEAAAGEVINGKLKAAGGEGGLIAVDAQGNITMPFNSEGMYRGYAKPGERVVAIYRE